MSECKCSVFRESVQSVLDFLGSCRPSRPNSLLARAWGIGFGLVVLDIGLMLLIMGLFPPNIITVPIVVVLFFGIGGIIVAVGEGYERCVKQCWPY